MSGPVSVLSDLDTMYLDTTSITMRYIEADVATQYGTLQFNSITTFQSRAHATSALPGLTI